MKLHLSLKREYFDAIKAGTKVEEYRLVTDYWTKRLHNMWGSKLSFDGIVLTKGYPKREDTERRIELPWLGFVRKTITHPHFGPNPVEVFAIDVSGRQALKGGE
ncbi:ASCH domain-containing protein [Brucella sp.]|uniref:ASCH domain-containing protein n=1 Tax=Brucella sp. TaxID=52132 RepID=UPI0028B24F09|nr:ASCH domain-containing protein [Brucella sp.]